MSALIGRIYGGVKITGVVKTVVTSGGNYLHTFSTQCITCDTEGIISRANLRTVNMACVACRAAARKTNAEKGVQHPLYKTWLGAAMRCYSTSSAAYKHYGARGVFMDDRWRGARANGERIASIDGFPTFCADMGPKPTPAHSLGRLDNDGPYAPWNCAWQTQTEQANNTRQNVWIIFEGVQRTVTQWALYLGANAQRFRCAVNALGGEAAIRFYASIPQSKRNANWYWHDGVERLTPAEQRRRRDSHQKNWRAELEKKFPTDPLQK